MTDVCLLDMIMNKLNTTLDIFHTKNVWMQQLISIVVGYIIIHYLSMICVISLDMCYLVLNMLHDELQDTIG